MRPGGHGPPDLFRTLLAQPAHSRITVGILSPVAEWTGEGRADPRIPRRLVDHPGSHLPRRIMPDVLGVTALQLRHPMLFRVLVKSGDVAVH